MSAVFNTTDRVLMTSTGGVIDPYATVDVDTDDPSVVDAMTAGYLVHAAEPESDAPEPDAVAGETVVVAEDADGSQLVAPAPKPPKSKSTAAPVEE